ncbi:MAG: hypothetical protein AAF488_07820 [Planctomycetota bacterium]
MLTRILLFALIAAIVGCSLQALHSYREKSRFLDAIDGSVALVVENHAKGATRNLVDQIFNERLRWSDVVRQTTGLPRSYCEILAEDLETLERVQWVITSPGRFDVFLVDEDSPLEEYRKEQLEAAKPDRKVVWPAGKPKTLAHAIVVKTDRASSVQDLRFDSATASADLFGEPALRATLSPSDTRLVKELTSQSLEKQVVITIDGVAVVVATIKSELGAEILITGTDALPVPLEDVVAIACSGPYPRGAELQAEIVHR